jgi:photosystem II stability/assembly factor-like uncharacterized protein
LWAASANGQTNTPCAIQRAAAVSPHVWLLCEQKDLLMSSDEGKTWRTKHLPSDERFRAIAFLDSRRGFVAGDGGTLLATEDGAETWRQIPLPTRDKLTSLHFVGDHGWLAGWSGLILHSSDGGRTWESQQSGVQQGLDSIFFVDANHGWAVGWVGIILRTTNGGRTWERVRAPNALWSLSAVHFRDAQKGWVVGFNGQILRSKDGGLTWEQQASPVRAWLNHLVFDPSGRGWVAAESHLLVSEDGGETWGAVAAGRPLFLHQMLAVKDSLWAVGQLGILTKAGGEQGFVDLATLPGSNRSANQS